MTSHNKKSLLVIASLALLVVAAVNFIGFTPSSSEDNAIRSADGTAESLRLENARDDQLTSAGDAINFRYVYNENIYNKYLEKYGQSPNEKIFSLAIDEYSGDLPDRYLASAGGAVDSYGYPIRENFLQELSEQPSRRVAARLIPEAKAQSPLPGTSYEEDPQYPGLYHCKEDASDVSYFLAYFEDDGLYAAGEEGPVGFADSSTGDAKKTAACDVLVEFDEMLQLDDFERNPSVVFYRDSNDIPPSVLMHGSSYFLDFSDNFSHSFLQKYIVSGADPTPGLGNFEGFVEVNHNIPWGF
jgi:hypothetical protein